MTLEEFQGSLSRDVPPAGLSPYLLALWHEKRGGWETAHEIVQDMDTSEAASIHAYLHRREGDTGNAQYWYRRAHKQADLQLGLDDEWETLVRQLL